LFVVSIVVSQMLHDQNAQLFTWHHACIHYIAHYNLLKKITNVSILGKNRGIIQCNLVSGPFTFRQSCFLILECVMIYCATHFTCWKHSPMCQVLVVFFHFVST